MNFFNSVRRVSAQAVLTLAPKAIEEPGFDPLKCTDSQHVSKVVAESMSRVKDRLANVELYKREKAIKHEIVLDHQLKFTGHCL